MMTIGSELEISATSSMSLGKPVDSSIVFVYSYLFHGRITDDSILNTVRMPGGLTVQAREQVNTSNDDDNYVQDSA
jgi:hypothetical protein